ncbi:MAG: hypothetical protein Q4F28_08965 [Eubacteriales bacterium]|nr:hypothetical protein [Eubacteriales bacterium]
MAGVDVGFKVDEWGSEGGAGEQVELVSRWYWEVNGIWDRHEVLDNKVPFQEIIVQTAADFH